MSRHPHLPVGYSITMGYLVLAVTLILIAEIVRMVQK